MGRVLSFAYGVIAYAVFFLTFCYAVGFVGNLVVPKSIDSPAEVSVGRAIVVNLVLLSIFAIQHSVMARPGFKRWWTKFVPKPIERSTFVLFASLALILMFSQWQPVGGVIWNVQDPIGRAVLYGIFALGWGLVLLSTFLINHFDLFGLRQVWLHLRGREYTSLRFGTPGPYGAVRHPLYLGFILGFWAAPTMTVTHLLFAAVTTAYILVAIQLEERDLIAEHGESYRAYRRQVPMLVPSIKKSRAAEQSTAGANA